MSPRAYGNIDKHLIDLTINRLIVKRICRLIMKIIIKLLVAALMLPFLNLNVQYLSCDRNTVFSWQKQSGG